MSLYETKRPSGRINQLNLIAMKVVFVLWTSSLVVSLFFGIGYAVYQLVSENIPPIYI